MNGAALRSKAFAPARVQRRALVVSNAITRQKKEQIVSTLKEKLDSSTIVFGFRFKNLDVATIQKFRKGMPENSSVMVAKNSLVRVAVGENAKWKMLAEKGCSGENAWVFVNEETIADTVKHYFKFESDLFESAKKSAPKNVEVKKPTELSVVIMDNKVLSPAELKKCEALPTKKQLYATIAGLAKQPATKIATGIKMVPTKLAIAMKKLSELDEDKSKTIGSFAK